MKMSQVSLLYTTFASDAEALRVSQELVKKRLIFCANILGPIKSVFTWQEKLEETSEVGVFLKTLPEKVEKTIHYLEKIHPYEIPAILEIPITHANEAFCIWGRESLEAI
ncbi:MAG: divalent ion tolerance protein CutA1 [uncultured bacterium]|nr:MAG: divalent ion tolerance protein CutA1 [uncultured bacterium]HBG33929.1 divalent-cation tolerance protein CutA [Holosporales bacterium]HBW24733.1 divalent-cation tolerance protein CutA [Holosporales bacterium]HCC25165.1 divalent-cation tolerance protein CutA [Holosporales bacterium]HCE95312.1 divalent-cation tolerance protein CutA [Holosporales bacterium]